MIMIVVSLLMPSRVATANDIPVTPDGISSYEFLPDPDYLQSDTKALIKINGDISGLPPIRVEWKDPQGTTVSCGTVCNIINEYSAGGTILVATTWEFYIAKYLRPPGTYTAVVYYCSFMGVNNICIIWTESFRANFTIGSVTNTISGNAGIAGATLFYIDGIFKTVVADETGNYTITVPFGWSGTVIPLKTGFTFLPVSTKYTEVITAQTEQNYTATPIATNTISGNAGIAGATLLYNDVLTRSVVADGTGNYTITINSGWSGIVRPIKTGFTFLPVSRTYTNVITAQTEQNYTATPINYPVYLPVVIR
jgi:hypothetical protein